MAEQRYSGDGDGDGDPATCPACGGVRVDGHVSGCDRADEPDAFESAAETFDAPRDGYDAPAEADSTSRASVDWLARVFGDRGGDT